MEIKEINLISRSKIEVVLCDEKSVIIQGELMGTPEFEAYKSSVKEWILPNKSIKKFKSAEKNELIQKIIEFANSKVNGSIYFVD